MSLPHQVQRDLVRLVESEELGEASFATAAKVTTDDSRRAQLVALYQLEVQTKRGVRNFIERCELDLNTANAIAAGVGLAGGAFLHLMPEPIQLASLKLVSKRYLPAFRRLNDYYLGTEHWPFFDYVVAHELAIIDFAEMARFHNGCALDAVNRLLDMGIPE